MTCHHTPRGLLRTRTWLALGATFGLPVALLTGGVLARLCGAVNAAALGPVPVGNLGALAWRHLASFCTGAVGTLADGVPGGRLCDVLSIVCVGAALALAAWRGGAWAAGGGGPRVWLGGGVRRMRLVVKSASNAPSLVGEEQAAGKA